VTESLATYDASTVGQKISTIREQKVILDADLAAIYGVETKALNRAVKRNIHRFPADFIFQLTKEEDDALRCQIGTSKGKGGRRYLPYAFTEHGAIMAATVLNSPRAVQTSVFIVRAFVRMRAVLMDTRELARKLAALEREVKSRLDTHDAAIVDNLSRIMDLIDPPSRPEPPEPPRKLIGFGVKESRAKYTTKATATKPKRKSAR